jgi:hypothetical protein
MDDEESEHLGLSKIDDLVAVVGQGKYPEARPLSKLAVL